MIQTDKVPLRFEFDISLPSGSATLTPDQKWTKTFLHISYSENSILSGLYYVMLSPCQIALAKYV